MLFRRLALQRSQKLFFFCNIFAPSRTTIHNSCDVILCIYCMALQCEDNTAQWLVRELQHWSIIINDANILITFLQDDPKDWLPVEWDPKYFLQRQEICHQTHWQEISGRQKLHMLPSSIESLKAYLQFTNSLLLNAVTCMLFFMHESWISKFATWTS